VQHSIEVHINQVVEVLQARGGSSKANIRLLCTSRMG
jgi:hypothetical protein